MFKDEEIRPIVDEVVQVCTHLKISSDPMQWSVDDSIKWLVYYIQLLKLNNQILDTFKILNGQSLCNLKIDDFHQVHAVDLYWKLQVWKKCLNFGTANHLHFERETSECDTKSDTKSWNSAESFDLSDTINMNTESFLGLDEDFNYTLTCLDDDLFKLDGNYHSNQCLPSLDDISLPSFYTSSINSNFKLDSKDKDEIVRLSTENGCLHSIYEFNYQLNSPNLDKCNQQDLQQTQHTQTNNLIKQADSTYYSNQMNQLNQLNDQESAYLTNIQSSTIQQQVSNQSNIQSNYQNHQLNGHQQSINSQQQKLNQNLDQQLNARQLNQQVSSTSSPPQNNINQYQSQYLTNTIQLQSTSLPSVASLKSTSSDNLNNTSNALNTNLNTNLNTILNTSNLNLLNASSDPLNQLSQTNQQLELNNSTNQTIKMNTNSNCTLNTAYYQTDQMQHHHHQNNNYHHHRLNVQNHSQFISTKSNNSFMAIDSNQLNSSASSNSPSNSSNSSPLPSLNSPALSPDNLTGVQPSITSTTNGGKKSIGVVRANGKHGRNNIQLWQFLKELLNQPHLYENCIKWINRKEGEFRIVNSVLVANLWGKRKNRPKMNYDKLSRSIRQYYKKNIMIKTTKSQRLVYKFVGDYMK